MLWLPFAVLLFVVVCRAALLHPRLYPEPRATGIPSADSTYEDPVVKPHYYHNRHSHPSTAPAAAAAAAPPRVVDSVPDSATVASSTRSTPSPPRSPTFALDPPPIQHHNPPTSSTAPPAAHRHRAPRPSFSQAAAARPPPSRNHHHHQHQHHGSSGGTTGGNENYLASASGSQTEGGQDSDDDSTDSDMDDEDGEDDAVHHKSRSLGEGLLDGFARGGRRSPLRRTRSPAPLAGEHGRGEHVLVEKRSNMHMHAGERPTTSWDGLRHGAWGSTLFDRESISSSTSKRRPSSPALSIRSARASPRGRPSRPTPEPIPREPSPPLTIDSIQSTYNPFPLFHIRLHLLPEVLLLLGAVLFAFHRLYTMQPTATFPAIPALPYITLSIVILVVPLLTLFRRHDHYFKVPFTDERGYRDPKAADDGIATAVVLPLLLACACYWDAYAIGNKSDGVVGLGGISPLVRVWEATGIHAVDRSNPSFDPSILATPLETSRALFTARYELLLLTGINAVVLLVHLALAKTLLRIERLPKSNAKRFFGFMGVANLISLLIYAGFSAWDWAREGGLPISPLEAGATTLIQQSSFYIVSRLARRGFTLGELNTMTVAGNALCLEFWRLSRARWNYKRGFPTIPPTFRSPTPVVAFQSVLIPGAFLSGFLLSPLLVISRHIASKPSHRLKWPTERERHRRLLAFGVFLGLFGIVFLMLGGWAGWMLGARKSTLRRPWTWALRFVYHGGDGVVSGAGKWQRWKRIWLVAYWAATIVVAVGGWQTRLVRARRIRMRALEKKKDESGGKKEDGSQQGVGTDGSMAGKTVSSSTPIVTSVSSAIQQHQQQQSQLKHQGVESKVGAEWAREEKRVHASLNMRRKFFHALAVTMFVPGIAVDPAFTSLAFSVAFALFTFCEYARYFALYPVGAPLHIFFSEFIDSKDSGPVILSHFYLLTGCAGGLWLEGRGVNRFTGVLVLGVGDAMASIVGKYLGRLRWPGTSKTVEGTLAFVFSITFCAWLLRLTGLTPFFSLPRYLFATTLAGLLEASSAQNDNLVIPLYMYSLTALLDV